MDDHVLRGMAKWPNVPAVYGWLALDRRGQWLLKGERIVNPAIVDFIGRNYEHDEAGRWFFQNGPQRVFVELEYTPLVLRVTSALGAPLALAAQTGAAVQAVRGAFIDEAGAILLDTDVGPGLVLDRDLEAVVHALVDAEGAHPDEDALEALIDSTQHGANAGLALEHRGTRAPLRALASAEAPRRLGYDARPTPPAGHPECTP